MTTYGQVYKEIKESLVSITEKQTELESKIDKMTIEAVK